MKRIGYSVILSIILLTLAFAPVLADTPTPGPTATATTYPTPTTVPTPSASFKVNTSGITVLVAPDGSKYTVSGGVVTLPTNQTWYADLIANGTLSLATVASQTITTLTATTGNITTVNATTVKTAALNNTGSSYVDTSVITTSLSLGGIAFTGAMKYGRALSVSDGSTIAHGLGATPTMCIVSPEHTSTFSQTLSIRLIGPTYITVSIGGIGAVTTLTAVDWMCGK